MNITSKRLFNEPKFLAKPFGWLPHTPFAFFLIESLKPEIFVELGTHSGNSYFAFCQAVDEMKLSTKCYAVDTWVGDEHSGFYEKEVFERVKSINTQHYQNFSYLLEMKFDDALQYFSDGSVDLLHIDGCHTYEAVKHDYEAWLPKVSNKGVVVLHDTNVRERGFGVWKLFEEIRQKYSSFELLHGHGLGVICVGKNVNPEFLEFAENAKKDSFIHNYFATLGNRIRTIQEKNDLMDEVRKVKPLIKQYKEEIDKKNKEIRVLKEETVLKKDEAIKELETKLDELKTENKKKSKKISEEEIQQKRLQEKIDNIKTNNEILNSKLAEKEETVLKKYKAIKELETRLDELKTEVKKKSEIISEEEIKQKRIKEKIENIRENNKKLTFKLSENKNTILENDEIIKEYELRIKQLQENKTEKKEIILSYEFKLEEYKKAVAKNEKLIAKLESKLDNLKDEISKKNEEVKSYSFEVKEHEQKLFNKNERIFNLEQAENELRKTLSQREELIDSLHEKLDQFKIKLYEREGEIKRLKEKQVELIKSTEDLSAIAENREIENDRLKNELSIINEQFSIANEKVKQQTELAEMLKNQLNEHSNVLEEKEKKISKLKAKLYESQINNEQYESKLEYKEKELQNLLNSASWRITKPFRLLEKAAIYIWINIEVVFRIIWHIITFRFGYVKRELRDYKYFRIISKSGMFDLEWYKETYPDIKKSGIHPIKHYIRRGADEGRDPSPKFSANYYLNIYKDVANSGINPLIHYILFGKSEGRIVFEVDDKNKTKRHDITIESKEPIVEKPKSLADGDSELSQKAKIAKQVLKEFITTKLPSIEKESMNANESYWKWRKQRESWQPSVMIGTLYIGENEIEACKKGIKKQDYKHIDHIIFEGLPKKEAMSTLYEKFLGSSHDILIKIDADMVVIDQEFVSKVVNIFRFADDVALLQMAIMDYYTGGPIQGVNAYSKKLTWSREKQDALFTDKVPVPKKNRLVVWTPFIDSVIHAPLSSDFHSFHFGVHRALKVKQGIQSNNYARGVEQFQYLERTWEHYNLRKEKALLMALLGAELALRNNYKVEDLDYTNPKMRNDFNNWKEWPEEKLFNYIIKLREEHLLNNKVQQIRNDRINITAKPQIKSVIFLLPHTKIFGGVNRFFELSMALERLGVSCTISIPDKSIAPWKQKTFQRKDYSSIKVVPFTTSMRKKWDVIVCGDFSSGIINLMPFFDSGLTVFYILNGWQHRVHNITQMKLANPDIVVANSSYAANHYPELASHILAGGINTNIFHPGEELFIKNKKPIICVPSGRGRNRKRFQDAYEAISILKGNGWDMELYVITGGSVSVDENQVAEDFINVSAKDVRKLLCKSDIILTPEEDAGWNNPAAEALACKRPLVCTQAGTTDFAFHEKTAMIVPPRDPKAIAKAVEYLLKNPEKAFKIAEAGHNKIQEFSWMSVARSFMSIVEKSRIDFTARNQKNKMAKENILKSYNLKHEHVI